MKQSSAKKSVLVIGAGGYIGQMVARKLAQRQKIRVLVLDAPPRDFIDNPNIEIFKASVFNLPVLRKALQNVGTVVNFAGSTSVEKRFPKHLRLNVLAQGMLLEECLKKNIAKIIYMSTINAYGNSAKMSLETDSLNPKDVYSFTKVLGERVYQWYAARTDITVVILRLGSVYGPSQRKGIVHAFAESARHKRAIHIPKQPVWRDLVFVEDAVSAIGKAIHYPAKNLETFNVAGSQRISLEQLARTVQKLLPFKIKILKDRENPELTSTWASCAKAKARLKFLPKVSLTEGLQETLSSYKL